MSVRTERMLWLIQSEFIADSGRRRVLYDLEHFGPLITNSCRVERGTEGSTASGDFAYYSISLAPTPGCPPEPP